MKLSLADVDLELLSPAARRTLDEVARPVAENDVDLAQHAKALGCESKDLTARLRVLADELIVLAAD
jgi:hypothetical protein